MTKLRAGDWVEVRSKEEILQTLDKSGRLEGMPFMPQMFEYCGMRLQVYKRAHKTCDTVNPTAGRRVPDAVHLETRCDGRAYGGCQANCLIFWKEAWLRRVGEPPDVADASVGQSTEKRQWVLEAGCSESDVWRGTRHPKTDSKPKYSCQATDLPRFVKPLAWWDASQYIEDYTSGNTSIARIARGLLYLFVWHILLAKRGRLGRPTRLLCDWVQRKSSGIPFPRGWSGTVRDGQPEPRGDLNLQPGELVRVKSLEEISATLSKNNMNRGLLFDGEMVPFCGKTYRVKSRVERFVDERTGYIRFLKTPAVILENVWCRAGYSNCRMFCPRSIYCWCREIWLDRIPEDRTEKVHASAQPIPPRKGLE